MCVSYMNPIHLYMKGTQILYRVSGASISDLVLFSEKMSFQIKSKSFTQNVSQRTMGNQKIADLLNCVWH